MVLRLPASLPEHVIIELTMLFPHMKSDIFVGYDKRQTGGDDLDMPWATCPVRAKKCRYLL